MHIHLHLHLDWVEISALPLISRNKVYFLTEPKIIMFTILLPLFHVALPHARFQLKCVVLTREFFRAVARCGVANDFVLYGGQQRHQTAEEASEMGFGAAFVVCSPRKCIESGARDALCVRNKHDYCAFGSNRNNSICDCDLNAM